MSRPEEEFREFAGSRAASLHRTAYPLCGDWHLADDLVQETFVQPSGVDISAAMLGKARAAGPDNITYIHADITRHPRLVERAAL